MISSQRWRSILIIVLLCTVLEAVQMVRWLPFLSIDLRDYVLPWYEHVLRFGRWRSMEASFANYSPPYIYVLCSASIFHRFAPAYVVIKTATAPFLLLAGFATWRLGRALELDQRLALAVAFLVPLLPEVAENSWHWGQCDIIHTAFLLLAISLLLTADYGWAFMAFGIAVSFKLQAIFAAPALLSVLITRRVPWRASLSAVGAFCCMLVPALLAGRSIKSLSEVFTGQYEYYHRLTLGCPNIYVLLEPHAKAHERLFSSIGFLLAIGFSVWVVIMCRNRPSLLSGVGLIYTFTAPLLFLPFLLPKMHERYFFAGDCLLVILAFCRPVLLPSALLMQAAILICYRLFLHGIVGINAKLVLPFAMVSVALGMFMSGYLYEAGLLHVKGELN